MPVDRRRTGIGRVGIAHGHEEDGGVEVNQPKAVRGRPGKDEQIEVMEEEASEEEGLLGEGEGVEASESEREVWRREEEEDEAGANEAVIGGEGGDQGGEGEGRVGEESRH